MTDEPKKNPGGRPLTGATRKDCQMPSASRVEASTVEMTREVARRLGVCVSEVYPLVMERILGELKTGVYNISVFDLAAEFSDLSESEGEK